MNKLNLKFTKKEDMVNEDQLIADDRLYDELYPFSWVDGVRVFPHPAALIEQLVQHIAKLEENIPAKFKIGDKVSHKVGDAVGLITSIEQMPSGFVYHVQWNEDINRQHYDFEIELYNGDKKIGIQK